MSKNTILSSVLAATVSSWALVSTSAAETIHHTRHATNTLSDQNLCAVSSDILRKEIHTYTKPHFIQSGEVIWSIAQKYGISWDQLIEIRKATESIPTNQSVNWTKIQAGKTIQVPINSYAVKQIQLYTALQEKKNLDQELNALHEQGKMWTLQKKLNEVTPWLFPKEVVNLGINAMTQGLMGNMRDDFTPDNPIINDKLFQREVDCAGKIKAFFGFSLENTSDLKQLVASKDQDAWILLGSLIDLGFTRKVEDDFMIYFDKNKVGQREIIQKGEELNYYRAIQDLSVRIKSQGVPWSVIGAYFKGSNYKHIVKEEYQKRVKSGKNYHINTHQFKILGNNTLEFPASSVRDFRTSTGGIDMWESMSSIDFVINYIQDKAPYQSIRSESRRDIIEKWLKIFHESLEVKINGVSIDLLEEIQKPEWERTQIQSDDSIEFFGPVAMDWFHVKTSDNKFKSENNTTRTFFFIQALVNPDFVISEKIEPNKKMQGHKPSIGGIEYEIPVRNLLFAQEWDLIETVYKEAILKYIMWKKELLDYTPKQLENLNAIEAQKDISLTGATVIALNSKRAKLRKNRITETIETLSTQEQTTLHRHYTQQIRALKLLGYMQNESELNPGAVKTHAPLPLIDTTKINIDAIYTNYLNKRKQELQAEYKNSCHIDRNFLEIRFLEWDTSIQIFDRIASELSYHAERFPSFGNLWDFTPLQKQEFLYELTKNSEIPGLNITAGKIPSSGNTIVGLPEIYTLVERISTESYLPEIELSQVDKIVTQGLADTEYKRNYYAYVLAKESYEVWFPMRKVAKEIARITKIRASRSFGDAQLRFANLLDPKRALNSWPNKQHIEDFLRDFKDPKIQATINYFLRFEKYHSIIQQDLQQVEKLRNLVTQITPETKIQIAQQIYDIIIGLLRFDDGSGSNIIWKVATISFLDNKVESHYDNAINWMHQSGRPIHSLITDSKLKERLTNLILTIWHRWEATILKAISENYILRVLETSGIDTQHSDFPKPEVNLKWQVDYTKNTSSSNLDFYSTRLSGHTLEQVLTSNINNIQENNFSSSSIFELFKNKEIQEFLRKSEKDTHMLPTMSEFQTQGLRKILFDYTTPPTGRTPPKPDSLASNIIKFFKIIWKNGNALENLALLSWIMYMITMPISRPIVWRLYHIIRLWTTKSDLPKALELFGMRKTATSMRRKRSKKTIKYAYDNGPKLILWALLSPVESIANSSVAQKYIVKPWKRILQNNENKKIFQYGKKKIIEQKIQEKISQWNTFGITDDKNDDNVWKQLEEAYFEEHQAKSFLEKRKVRKKIKQNIISSYRNNWKQDNPSLKERIQQQVSGIFKKYSKTPKDKNPEKNTTQWWRPGSTKDTPPVESIGSPIAHEEVNPTTTKIQKVTQEIKAFITEIA